MYYCYLETPVGELIIAGDQEVLRMVEFPVDTVRRKPFAPLVRPMGAT